MSANEQIFDPVKSNSKCLNKNGEVTLYNALILKRIARQGQIVPGSPEQYAVINTIKMPVSEAKDIPKLLEKLYGFGDYFLFPVGVHDQITIFPPNMEDDLARLTGQKRESKVKLAPVPTLTPKPEPEPKPEQPDVKDKQP